MRKSSRTTEGELESLFEQETSKDHEVVPVAVLGLHYLRRLLAGFVHVDHVLGFSG